MDYNDAVRKVKERIEKLRRDVLEVHTKLGEVWEDLERSSVTTESMQEFALFYFIFFFFQSLKLIFMFSLFVAPLISMIMTVCLLLIFLRISLNIL